MSMHKTLMFFIALFLSCVLAMGAPPEAAAKDLNGYVTKNVNLRAGPDEGYPPIKLIREKERVIIAGCLDDLKWCEVESDGERGWVYAGNLDLSGKPLRMIPLKSAGGTTGSTSIRIIIFEPRNYWNRYYQGKPFYKDRDQWLKDRDSKDGKDGKYHEKKNWSASKRPDRPPQTDKSQDKMEKPVNEIYKKLKEEKGYNPLCPYNVPDC